MSHYIFKLFICVNTTHFKTKQTVCLFLVFFFEQLYKSKTGISVIAHISFTTSIFRKYEILKVVIFFTNTNAYKNLCRHIYI